MAKPSLKAPVGGSFEIPSEGPVQGVCVDLIDLGVVPGFEGRPEHKIELVFQVDEFNEKGDQRLEVRRRFTLSMNAKSNLRKFIQSWRGKPLTDEEAGEFELYDLIGQNAMLQIVHQPSDKGGTWANIDGIMRVGKGAEKMEPENYKRREKKADGPQAEQPKPTGAKQAAKPRPAPAPEPQDEDEEVPF